jgi:hypothetical protein
MESYYELVGQAMRRQVCETTQRYHALESVKARYE